MKSISLFPGMNCLSFIYGLPASKQHKIKYRIPQRRQKPRSMVVLSSKISERSENQTNSAFHFQF